MPLILPSPQRKRTLKFIHARLATYKENGSTADLSKAIDQMLKDDDFKAYIHGNTALQKTIGTPEDMLDLAWAYLYSLLYARDYVAAAMVLWGEKTFTPEPRSAQLMWKALFEKNLINVMGCASCGKSFNSSAWCLLDWLLDPEWTRVDVASNSQDHVEKNLYADIVRLHEEAALKLPGQVDTESISLNKKRGFGIFVLVIHGGQKSRGKLKGAKIKNRPPHPLFGDNSRLRVILDEAQEIPANIFDETPNLLASVDNSIEHIKIFCAANPKDEWSRYGLNCKPTGGYEAITDDTEEWESETGWWTISINAMRTENIVQKKTVFPRMATLEGVQKIIRSQGGGDDQHPNVYTYVYGRFPKTGLQTTIIQSAHLRRAEGEWIFDGPTEVLGGSDPAFTGDLPTLATGRAGRAVAWLGYDGVRHELSEPAIKIQVDGVAVLPHGDTQDVADANMERCAQLNVKPENFGIDKTGTGRGAHDVIRRQWASKVAALKPEDSGVAPILGVEYAGSPSETKIAEEDSDTPAELYTNIATELWFAASKLFEYDVIRMGRGVDGKTFEELASRRGGMKVGLGKKQAVESKAAYKGRTGNSSPDRADATLILIHVARQRQPGIVPRAKDTTREPVDREPKPWAGFESGFAGSDMSGMNDGVAQLQGMDRD